MKTIVPGMALCCILLLSVVTDINCRRTAEERADRAEQRLERREQRFRQREESKDRQAEQLLHFFNELKKAGLIQQTSNTSDNLNGTEADIDPTNTTAEADIGPQVIENFLNSKPLLAGTGDDDTRPFKRQQVGSSLTSPVEPYDIENVNQGVSTILNGVSSLRLSEILRGSFMFTRNDRVKGVANSVIDTIFGKRDNDSLPTDAEPGERAGLFPLRGF